MNVRLLRAREVAGALDVSPETVLRWTRRGDLPAPAGPRRDPLPAPRTGRLHLACDTDERIRARLDGRAVRSGEEMASRTSEDGDTETRNPATGAG